MSKKPPIPPNQKLPPQYEAQFKQLVKFYESKQHKKALKAADAILKVHADHGETLSMKGLVLSGLERALWDKTPQEYAKLGLSKHLNSSVCWHVFGLIHRGERNYKEAIKCYRQALRFDTENLQIMRDLATLQTQVRDVTGLLETRNSLLSLKPNVKQNWIGLAIAHYLSGNYEVSFHILEAFEKATDTTESKVEISELQLFKMQVLMDGGEHQAALDCYEKVRSKILDPEVVLSLKGQCEMVVGKKDAAAATFVELLKRNVNCPDALLSYVKAKAGFDVSTLKDETHTPEQRRELLAILDDLDKLLDGKSKNLRRECLDLIDDAAELKKRVDAFARPYVTKNIPSLFSALRSLYARAASVAVLEELFTEWEKELLTNNKFKGDSAPNPTALLWVLIYLSMHHFRKGNHDAAMQYIERAIEHTPTLESLYATKGKILKHMGKHAEAAEQLDKARKLDLADRFLTNRAVKYMLRAGRINDAEELYATFSRAKPGEVISNLVELQTMWFELELGKAYYQAGDVRSALQAFLLVDKHFADFYDDQLDFHGYCLRKYTLRAYIDMIKFQDRYKSYKVYRAAAKNIVRCYLDISRDGLDAAALDSKVCEHAKKMIEAAQQLPQPGAATPFVEAPVCALGALPDVSKPLEAAQPFVECLENDSNKQDAEAYAVAASLHLRRGTPVVAARTVLRGIKTLGVSKVKQCAMFVAVAKELTGATSSASSAEVKQILREVAESKDIKAIIQ